MLICGPVDEVVGQIRPGFTDLADVVNGEIELLEGEPADLADHARDQVVGGLRQRVTFRPSGAVFCCGLLRSEETVGVQAKSTGTEIGQRMQCVADDEPHARE